jgi:LysM repeat protein
MDNETQQNPGAGIRMSHVFTAVVVLHVLVIGGAVLMSRNAAHPTAPPRAETPQSDAMAAEHDLPEAEPKSPDLRVDNEPTDEVAEVDAEAAPARSAANPRAGGPLPAPATARSAKIIAPVANLRGAPAPAPAPAMATKASAAPAASGSYTVAKGDTLSRIARKLKVSQQSLIAANNLKDPSKLSIGQKLVVPAATSRAEGAPAKPASKSSPSSVAAVGDRP